MNSGIYSSDVENLLGGYDLNGNPMNRFLDNILQMYDNYTYHIQMYMIPFTTWKEYDDSMYNHNYDTAKSILENSKKVVIVETGKTNNFSIDSFTIKAAPVNGYAKYSTAIYNLSMTLTEIAGNTFTNKITLVSNILGYKSYLVQPYFIKIWFSGYKNGATNADKIIEEKIPLKINNNETVNEITYCVQILSDVSSTSTESNTKYTLNMVPQNYYGLSQDIFSSFKFLENISLTLNGTLADNLKIVQERINENIEKQFNYSVLAPKVEIYYCGDFSSVTMDETFNKTLENQKNQDISKVVFPDATDESATKLNKDEREQKINEIKDKYDKYLTFSSEETDTVGTFITRFVNHFYSTCRQFSAASGVFDYTKYIPVITYDRKTIGYANYGSTPIIKYKFYIELKELPGLNDLVYGLEYGFSDYIKNAANNQINFLKKAFDNNCIHKRYDWLCNTTNINVLSYKSKENNLWTLNTGETSFYSNINNNFSGVDINEYYGTSGITGKEEDYSYSYIDKEGYVKNVKLLFDKEMSMDDIYYTYLSINEDAKYDEFSMDRWFNISCKSSINPYVKVLGQNNEYNGYSYDQNELNNINKISFEDENTNYNNVVEIIEKLNKEDIDYPYTFTVDGKEYTYNNEDELETDRDLNYPYQKRIYEIMINDSYSTEAKISALQNIEDEFNIYYTTETSADPYGLTAAATAYSMYGTTEETSSLTNMTLSLASPLVVGYSLYNNAKSKDKKEKLQKTVDSLKKTINREKSKLEVKKTNDTPSAARELLMKQAADKIKEQQKNNEQKKLYTSYRLGLANIFYIADQRSNVEIEIIGDPFWLSYGNIFEYENPSKSSYFPYFVFGINSYFEQDHKDEYSTTALMSMDSVYMVTDITSVLSNGKFTQTLQGFIPVPFLISTVDNKNNNNGVSTGGDNIYGIIGDESTTGSNGSVISTEEAQKESTVDEAINAIGMQTSNSEQNELQMCTIDDPAKKLFRAQTIDDNKLTTKG